MSQSRRTQTPRVLKADKRGLGRRAVEAMIHSKMRDGFHSILAQGLDAIRAEIDREPDGTLFLANHSNWWDLFLVHTLSETIPVDGYGMMEHANLKRFGFFRKIGAFSVDRTDPVSIRASLDYAVELLKQPRAGVWIFPQGKIVPNDRRPLGFQPGIRALIRRAGRVRVVPVAFRYEFWQDERPEALVRFGPARWVEPDQGPVVVEQWETAVTQQLDQLKTDAVAESAERFSLILGGKPSISERYARFKSWLGSSLKLSSD